MHGANVFVITARPMTFPASATTKGNYTPFFLMRHKCTCSLSKFLTLSGTCDDYPPKLYQKFIQPGTHLQFVNTGKDTKCVPAV